MSDARRARELALALPDASEEPHFDMTSFRVRGKIFATVPPDEDYLHVFLDEAQVPGYVAEHPAVLAPLRWGQRVRGLRIHLAAAADGLVAELLTESWRRKAPARLVAGYRHGEGRASAG